MIVHVYIVLCMDHLWSTWRCDVNQSVDSNFDSGLLPDDWSRVSQRGRKGDQNPRGDGVASECCLMEKSMRPRAQKGGTVCVCVCVCVWNGLLDGLTKVGRNGQKRSVDGKGQPYS